LVNKENENIESLGVAIVGLGYVGLPIACLCAKGGYKTIGFDNNGDTIDRLKRGESHIRDTSVENLFSEAIASGNFIPTRDSSALLDSSIYLICVPTPVNSENKPDLKPLLNAINTIAPFIEKGDLIVVESTVFPGTCEDFIAPLLTELTGFECNGEISLVHCPERVNPGDVFWSAENIPRVLGGMDESGSRLAANFYASILGGDVLSVQSVREALRPKFSLSASNKLKTKSIALGSVTLMRSIRDAEAVKVMENTVRDVNIAFMNELAQISDALNLDIVDIIDGMSTKPFGKGPYYPGAGVGGHCIAVDPEWLNSASVKAGYLPKLIQTSRAVNNYMPRYVVHLLRQSLNRCEINLKEAKIAVLGVAYKKNVDDDRESPFYEIKEILLNSGATVSVYDSWFSSENTSLNLNASLLGCDAIILVTDHDDMMEELSNIDYRSLGIRVIIDGRNALNFNEIPGEVIYRGIGRCRH